MKSSCMFWQLSRKMVMDGWTKYAIPLRLAFPRLPLLLHNNKTTDNSPEAHPCLFLSPHVPQVLLFIISCTQVLQDLL